MKVCGGTPRISFGTNGAPSESIVCDETLKTVGKREGRRGKRKRTARRCGSELQ